MVEIIYGRAGSGKTFFVKQVKMVMEAYNPYINHATNDNIAKIKAIREKHYQNKVVDLKPHIGVYYDAWENDNDEDPILSLIFTIIQSVYVDYRLVQFLDNESTLLP